ncbi:Dihydrofolate reductase [Neolecta irregularis DAH-3]|uniref:Dihydrofolate reductase n=1 Tax=Neolecta irregularis (strain DAH-3) TaxID=1198029 RepID=A0A1U7LIC4_NEOID|nr:Dihydrofolate reductase [Neolecta irregularis DAH-3]|eukprot:OLL22378.1 Dihydrofolate reductase [Neolecta irregularis DAH-3]
MRVLCLHGYHQSGPFFRKKIAGLISRFPEVEFICISSPLKIASEYLMVPPKSPNGEDVKAYTWWVTEENQYIGLETSFRSVFHVVETQGPFDGILGFSMGACLAGALISMFERKQLSHFRIPVHPPFRFVLFFTGFLLTHRPDFYQHIIQTPSLHFMGNQDYVIPNAKSEALVRNCLEPKVVRFTGGHCIPQDEKSIAMIREFLTPFNDGQRNLSALENMPVKARI